MVSIVQSSTTAIPRSPLMTSPRLGLVVLVLAAAACGQPADGATGNGQRLGLPTLAPSVKSEHPGDDTRPEAAADAKEAAEKETKEAQRAEHILAAARAPMTTADVDETLRFIDDWRANAANQHARKAWKDARALKKQKSTAGKLREVRTITKAVDALEDVESAFQQQIARSGGIRRHYARSVRVGSVVAAAEQIARIEKLSPTSDRVAELMLEQRAEIAAEMRASLEDWIAAKQRGKRDAPIVTAFVQGPGAIALGLLPEASFEHWRRLSEAQRTELRGAMKELLTPVVLAGLDYTPGLLLYTAAVQSGEKTPEALLK
jgi:hypothetical protein